MAMKTDIGALVHEQQAKKAAALKVAADEAAERKRREQERDALLQRRLDAFEVDVNAKCAETGSAVACKRTPTGFDLTYERQVLRIVLESVDRPEVDFRGHASIQRLQMHFFLTASGDLVEVTFKPHAVIGNPRRGDLHPSSTEEFYQWTVAFARMAATITPDRKPSTFADFVNEAIAGMVKLAE